MRRFGSAKHRWSVPSKYDALVIVARVRMERGEEPPIPARSTITRHRVSMWD